MTKPEFLEAVKDRYPKYRKLSDEVILERIQQRFLQAPEAVSALLADFQVNPGMFAGWLQGRRAEQQSRTLKAKADAVAAVERIQTITTASARQIPAQVYGEVVLEEEKARIRVWEQEQMNRLELEHAERNLEFNKKRHKAKKDREII